MLNFYNRLNPDGLDDKKIKSIGLLVIDSQLYANYKKKIKI